MVRNTDQILRAEDNVIFNTIPVKFGNCDLDGLMSSKILIWSEGYYNIYFNVYHTQPCQFGLFLNNILVPSTTVGSPLGSTINSLSTICYISPNDILVNVTSKSTIGTAAILEFRNHTSIAPIIVLNGQIGSGIVLGQNTATAVIFKL